ncbi:MAG: TIGR00730 family Rossman fold protein [Chloroflexi bacterium HGW-Chloroflexi-4]|nr:MAG: TIGR00730 family Rossman fold protein [Chloroflexi bacterium HGW-Chloroflexi-4]
MDFPYRSICVFCGSADGLDEVYYEAAKKMGKELASRGIRLVYGAGRTGLMGVLAQSVLENGGEVTGIAPKGLESPQLIRTTGLTNLEIVDDIQVRKARMIDLADAFISLPGGYGTADELFEVLTWSQIGLHRKPMAILNTNGYFDSLLAWINRAFKDAFIYDEHLQLFLSDSEPASLLDKLAKYQFPENIGRWLVRDN